MFERMATGWELAKQSVHVLKLDKELLLFPLISGLACLLVMASFALPLWQSGILDHSEAELQQLQSNPLTYVILFAYYFLNYFVIIFFNSALVACAIVRLKGGDPNVPYGFSVAMSRLPQIALWALLAATVGLILKTIESRSEKVGQIVAAILGMAWSVTTFFVVPVLVVEKQGPLKAISRSVEMMRRTWGESLTANFGVGLLSMLASLIAVVPIGFGIFALSNEWIPIGTALIALGVLWLLFVSLISSALNSVILAALYIYAAENEIASNFNSATIRSAFASK